MKDFRKIAKEGGGDYGELMRKTLACVPDGARDRLYPPRRTVALMTRQALDGNASCRKTVTGYQESRPGISGSGAAFCKARKRIGEGTVKGLFGIVDAYARGLSRGGGKFLGGRPVKAVDGTSFKAEDTAANRAEWDCPSGQKEGCGFPTLGALCVFSLDTRTFSAVSFANHTAHDLRLATGAVREGAFAKGDILVGDRAFCAYSFFSLLQGAGVDAIVRLHPSRTPRKNVAEELGRNEWVEVWEKPGNGPMKTLTEEEDKAAPETMKVRVIYARIKRKGLRTEEVWLATTLLDSVEYPAADIVEAYRMRWEIEVAFRDVKTVMGYEMVRGRTPESVRKQIYIALFAYNLCRTLMLIAAKGSRTRQAMLSPSRTAAIIFQILLFEEAGVKVPAERIVSIVNSTATGKQERPSYARCVKMRPKPYQFLTKPRAQFTEIRHRNRYTKNRAKTSETA